MIISKNLMLVATFATFATAAQASIIPIGSSLTFGGTNLPGACTDTTCSDMVTFSSTPVLIDGGALSLYKRRRPLVRTASGMSGTCPP